MKDYALITLEPLAFVREMAAPTSTKAGYRIVPVERQEKPAFDPLTHRLQAKRTVKADKVTDGWEAVALPTGEAKRAVFDKAIAAGYDTGKGYRLRLFESDRNAFTQLLVLLREANATDDLPTAVADTEGTVRQLTAKELRGILVGYGVHFQGLWQQLMAP